jgi:hypothetical protein
LTFEAERLIHLQAAIYKQTKFGVKRRKDNILKHIMGRKPKMLAQFFIFNLITL